MHTLRLLLLKLMVTRMVGLALWVLQEVLEVVVASVLTGTSPVRERLRI